MHNKLKYIQDYAASQSISFENTINKLISLASPLMLSESSKEDIAFDVLMSMYEMQVPQYLYHGTPNGIIGNIKPESNIISDFGQGFYTAELLEYAESMSIKRDDCGFVYKLSCNSNGLTVFDFKGDIEFWALYTAANRGYFDVTEYSKLKSKIDNLNNYDILIGLISDDRSAHVYNQFFNSAITDICMVECIKYYDLGKQFVFKTQKACDSIEIINKHSNTAEDVKRITHIKGVRLGKTVGIVEQLKVKYESTGLRLHAVLEKYR